MGRSFIKSSFGQFYQGLFNLSEWLLF